MHNHCALYIDSHDGQLWMSGNPDVRLVARKNSGEVNPLLFNVTCNDISVIYVTVIRRAGGLKKEVGPTVGFPTP